MSIIHDFIKLFTNDNIDFSSLDKNDNIYGANLSLNIDRFLLPNESDLFDKLLSIYDTLESNSFVLIVKIIDENTNNIDVPAELTFNMSKTNTFTGEFVRSLFQDIQSKDFNLIDDDQYLRLEIIINKPPELTNINRIYFFDEFMDYVNNLSLKQLLLNILSQLIVTFDDKVIFLIDSDIEPFYSDNIFFVHDKDEILILSNLQIQDIPLSRNTNCHFLNANLNVSPYSTFLKKRSNIDSVNIIFDKLTNILSIIYLANYSEILSDNVLKFHISGYKLINEDIDFTYELTNTTFFNIFKWVYDDSNIDDKINLARNIITLDYRENLDSINQKTIASIKSNYSIYLKDNVERYLDLKTKITDNILDLSMRSKEFINEFSSNFKNSFVANLSFIFSILIANIISNDSDISDIFNKDLTIIYLCVVLISFFYLVLSIINVYGDIKHHELTFDNLKNLYIGILSNDDLDSTFNNDVLKCDEVYIKKKVSLYSIFWVLSIIINIILLYILSSYFQSNVSKIINVIKEII